MTIPEVNRIVRYLGEREGGSSEPMPTVGAEESREFFEEVRRMG